MFCAAKVSGAEDLPISPTEDPWLLHETGRVALQTLLRSSPSSSLRKLAERGTEPHGTMRTLVRCANSPGSVSMRDAKRLHGGADVVQPKVPCRRGVRKMLRRNSSQENDKAITVLIIFAHRLGTFPAKQGGQRRE